MTGEMPEGMLAAVQFMRPQLEGLEIEDIAGAARTVDRLMYGNGGAKSAIDMALY